MVAWVPLLIGAGGCGFDRSRSILVRRVISQSAMAHWAQFRRRGLRHVCPRFLYHCIRLTRDPWACQGVQSAQNMEDGMQAERKKTCRSQQRERLWHASLRAEDAAVAYLHEFDPAVAFATACSVEQALAIDWEAEQEKMRRRRDPRKVMEISSTRVRELNIALARLPQGVHPDIAAERHQLQIVKDLPPDRAWWVSHGNDDDVIANWRLHGSE